MQDQALAAVALLYEHGAGLRIRVKRARAPRPGVSRTPSMPASWVRRALAVAVERSVAGHLHRHHRPRWRPAPVLPGPGRDRGAQRDCPPGIDVRSPGRHLGGYLVGPGSAIDGRAYAITRDLPITPLPTWLTAHLTRPLRERT